MNTTALIRLIYVHNMLSLHFICFSIINTIYFKYQLPTAAHSKTATTEIMLKRNSQEHRNKEIAYLQKATRMQRSPAKSPYLHCQPLDEI